MSDKQLSPITKAIAFYKEHENAFTPEALLLVMEIKLQSLLEEEKKFVQDAYVAGEQYARHDVREIETGEKNNSLEFVDYYKKYE